MAPGGRTNGRKGKGPAKRPPPQVTPPGSDSEDEELAQLESLNARVEAFEAGQGLPPGQTSPNGTAAQQADQGAQQQPEVQEQQPRRSERPSKARKRARIRELLTTLSARMDRIEGRQGDSEATRATQGAGAAPEDTTAADVVGGVEASGQADHPSTSQAAAAAGTRPVGLDIQQKFEVFYLGPKGFGNKMLSRHGKLEIDSCQISPARSPAARINKGGNCSQDSLSRKLEKRKCNHHCKNKDICGHDCCKNGVSQKSNMKKDSVFSSYLTDLRNRNAESAVPPVKKLKMQMLNKSQKVDLKQFCYTPRSVVPGLPRLGCELHSEFILPKEINNADANQRCLKETEVCREGEFFVSKKSAVLNEKSHRTTISNNLKESSMKNLTDADKSSALFSEPLKVNFELGNEVWDDYDDGSLIYASILIDDIEKTKHSESSHLGSLNTCLQSSGVVPTNLGSTRCFLQNTQSKPGGTNLKSFPIFKEQSDVPLWNSNSPLLTCPENVKPLAEYGHKNIIGFQEKKCSPEELKGTQRAAPSETVLWSSQVTRKEDFFICNKRITKEGDLRYQLPDDDIKPFLGIFDGIF